MRASHGCPSSTIGCPVRLRVALPVLHAALVFAACSGEEIAGRDASVRTSDPSVLVDGLAPAFDEALPEGYVLVPGGAAHRDCIHQIPDGHAFDGDGYFVAPDGTRTQIPTCGHPLMLRNRSEAIQAEEDGESTSRIGQPPPAANGWVESVNRFAGVGIKELVADFQVPPRPSNTDPAMNPLIYLFPGLERGVYAPEPEMILQPVLQWGDGYAPGDGKFWGIANWVVATQLNIVLHTNVVQVWQGNWIHGGMKGANCSGNVCANWTITVANASSGAASQPLFYNNTNGYGFFWIFGGAFEAYRVNVCSDFPNTVYTPFNNIYATQVNGVLSTGPWTGWVDHDGEHMECGQWVAPNTHNVQIGYRPAPPPVNHTPRGYLDAADCTSIRGWAQDIDAPEAWIDVRLYADGPAGQGALLGTVQANQYRSDLCGAIGSCNHGFTFPTPTNIKNGVTHSIYAYGMDTTTGNGTQLGTSPRSLTCGTPACSNECTLNSRMCADGSSYRHCGNYDGDPCTEWGAAQSCGFGYGCTGAGTCYPLCGGENADCDWDAQCCSGFCYRNQCKSGPICDDECFPGQVRCADSTHYQWCDYYDSDVCLEWGTFTCPEGSECSSGYCWFN